MRIALLVLAVWIIYGDVAALVAAVLLIGWAIVTILRKIVGALEELRIQLEILPAQGVMFGKQPAGHLEGIQDIRDQLEQRRRRETTRGDVA